MFVQGGPPTQHPFSSRPHFVCKSSRQRRTQNINIPTYFTKDNVYLQKMKNDVGFKLKISRKGQSMEKSPLDSSS
jgi:hypothetical protein